MGLGHLDLAEGKISKLRLQFLFLQHREVTISARESRHSLMQQGLRGAFLSGAAQTLLVRRSGDDRPRTRCFSVGPLNGTPVCAASARSR